MTHKIIRNSSLVQKYPALIQDIQFKAEDYLHSLIFIDDKGVITVLSYIWDTRKCIHAMQFDQNNAVYPLMHDIIGEDDPSYTVTNDSLMQITLGEAYMLNTYLYALKAANTEVFTAPMMLNLSSKTDKNDKDIKHWFVNGIEVCCSSSSVENINTVGKGGRLSKLRDRTAKCHSYLWLYNNLISVFGYLDTTENNLSAYARLFTPVRGGRYGDTGTAMNYRELKACIEVLTKYGFKFQYNR